MGQGQLISLRCATQCRMVRGALGEDAMIRRIALAAAASAMLAACGSEETGEFTTQEGETGEYTIDPATGETSARIETEEGTATMRSGASVPVNLPDGITIYPGASVVSNTVVDHAGGSGSMVTLRSEDAPQQIASHYRREAESAGFKIELEMKVDDGVLIGGEGPGGAVFSLNTSRDTDGSTLAQLMIGDATR